jgi:hypothetical protein
MESPRPTGERDTPPIEACRLWEKTSAKGRRYLTGRLGGVRVLVLENAKASGDDHTHVLLFAAAPPRDSKR